MAIIFSSNASTSSDQGVLEILETPFIGFAQEMMNRFNYAAGKLDNVLKGKGPPAPPAEHVFVDDGFSNVPGTSFVDSTIDNIDDIKMRRITSQRPQLTVYIKKRAFWGLSGANDSRYMDSGEKLYLRATKILFEKKCNQIASYEALTKLSRLADEDAQLDASRIEQVLELAETWKEASLQSIDDDFLTAAGQLPGGSESLAALAVQAAQLKRGISASADKVEEIREQLHRRQSKLGAAINTSWIIDQDNKDVFQVGRGAGTIELTLVSSAETSLGLGESNNGSFNFTIEDPYNLTKITSVDVETALSAAYKEKDLELQEGPSAILERAREEEQKLQRIRKNRIAAAWGFSQTAVGNSPAAEIIFEINVSSRAANKVVAYTTSTEIPPFDKDSFRLAMLQLPVEEQLSMEEDRLVGNIFALLESYVDSILKLNADVLDMNSTEDVRYARSQLRKHYLGKAIVQPMDSVHVYIRSNTVKPNQIVGPLSSVLNASSFAQDIARDPDASDAVLQEEMRQFNISDLVPLDLYKSIRTGSFMRNAGVHVFGGLVSLVNESYNAEGGTYKLQVSGESNLKWLNLSRVNTQPSLQQPRGMLEDPITPFKFDVDEATGQIKDMPELLPGINERLSKGLLFDKFGPYRGQKVTSNKQLKGYEPSGEDLKIIWKHAPGFVYKWKTGVMTATIDANLSTSLQGTESDLAYLKRYVGINVTPTPFAGQDAADTISLLVTGYPHSAERFFDNAVGIGTFTEAGSNASPSYFHSFFDITRSTNRALGNFRPFRSIDLELEGRKLAARMKITGKIKNNYSKIEELRADLAKALDQYNAVYDRPSVLLPDDPAEKERKIVKKGLEDVIDRLRNNLSDEEGKLQAAENEARSAGTQLDTSSVVFGLDKIGSGTENEAYTDFNTRVRLQNKILQLRPQYDCKFNTDNNLLIISDKYDNDLDIQAFIRRLTQQANIFESEFKLPLEVCREVARTLDFEFFCMAKDTIILTKSSDGTISSKYIEDFNDGDSVVSINQTTKEVSWKPARLFKRKLNDNESMLEIKDGQGNKIKLSNKHRLLDSNLNELMVEDISAGMCLGMAGSIPNTQDNIIIDISRLFKNHKWYKEFGDKFKIGGQGSRCKMIPKKIELDADISWLFGLYLAEGSVSDPENRNDKNSRGYHTLFSLHYDELDIATKIQEIIRTKFNITSKIYRYKKYNRCTVDVGSFVFARLIKSIFGRTTSHTKYIPDVIWRSTNTNKLACIGGILVGDGTYNRRLSISSVSNRLLNDISQLLLMIGIKSKLDNHNKLHIYSKESIKVLCKYTFNWKYNKNITKYCFNGNYFKNAKQTIPNAVKSVRRIEYDDYVYDLEVEDNHTFLIGHTWSHNCDTQGHIQFRPPQYNRVPLSLLIKMFLLNKNKGQQLYPEFLVSMFKSRLNTVREDEEILNMQISVEALALNINKTADDLASEVTSGLAKEEIVDSQFFRPERSKISDADIDDRANQIVSLRNKIEAKTGHKSNLQDIEYAKNYIQELNDPQNPQVNSLRLKITNRLKTLVGKLEQTKSLRSKLEAQEPIYTSGIGNFSREKLKDFLTPFQDLVQDDYNDFLGPGSSKRFIIYDDQIISSNFQESDANAFCRVDVLGEIDFIGDRPGEIAPGVPSLWAGATDFDMWRQYGYRALEPAHKPFLKNGPQQCAPYALFLLSRARRDVVRGTLTLYGNEYYQLGDVVYVNSRDMLFYVYNVKQKFSYESGSYTTELDLRYGHVLGEYIATPLDVIGKTYIRNHMHFNDILVSRETVDVTSGIHIGMVIFENEQSDNEFRAMLTEPYARFNVDELKGSLLQASNYVEKDGFPKVEVRGWVTNEKDISKTQDRMNQVIKWLQNPRGRAMDTKAERYIQLGRQFVDAALEPKHINNEILKKSGNAVAPVNLAEGQLEGDNLKYCRLPSDEVYNATEDANPTNIIEIVLIMEEPENV